MKESNHSMHAQAALTHWLADTIGADQASALPPRSTIVIAYQRRLNGAELGADVQHGRLRNRP
jgi:hypothetical protein